MESKKRLRLLLHLIFLLYIFLLIFPELVFANQFSWGRFTVYYHHKNQNPEQLKSIISDAETLLKASPLEKEMGQQKIFLTSSFTEFTFFAPQARKAFAVNYPLTQNIFIATSDILKNRSFRNGKTHNTRSLSSVIAHETTHSLIDNHFGVFRARWRIPQWKKEGYCEYIAQETSMDQQKGLSLFCQNDSISSPAFEYFKATLKTRFILEQENVSLASFFNHDFDKKIYRQKLFNFYCH